LKEFRPKPKAAAKAVPLTRVQIAQLNANQTCPREALAGQNKGKFAMHSVWHFSLDDFGRYGLGVRLYFTGLLQIGAFFTLLACLSGPQLVILKQWNFMDPGFLSGFYVDEFSMGNLGDQY